MNCRLSRSLFLGALFGAWCCAGGAKAKQYDMEPADRPTAEAEEPLSTPSPDGSSKSTTNDTSNRASLPFTPYPAGLPWVMTPQSFRVPIPDRIYYPPHTYVRRCPYYPRGYYWGANWRFNVIGRGNLLFFGTYRYNPYLTSAIASHDPELRNQRRYAPPPGPVGQAVLLGASGPGPVPLPPISVEEGFGSAAKASSPPTSATVRKAPERLPGVAKSSRRTSRTAAAQPTKDQEAPAPVADSNGLSASGPSSASSISRSASAKTVATSRRLPK
jgi:hypothetical protein